MKQSTILEMIRKRALWATIVSAFLLMVLLVLWAWGAFDFVESGDRPVFPGPGGDDPFGMGMMNLLSFDFELTPWGKIILSLAAILSMMATILLALLVAKYAKGKK